MRSSSLLKGLLLCAVVIASCSGQAQPFRVSRAFLLNFLDYVPGLCCEDKAAWCDDLSDPVACTAFHSCIGEAACDPDAMPTDASDTALAQHEFWCSSKTCGGALDSWCRKPEDRDRCLELFACREGYPEDYDGSEDCGADGTVPKYFAQRWCDAAACEIQFTDACENTGSTDKCKAWLACETPTWTQEEVDEFCEFSGVEEILTQLCEPSVSARSCGSEYAEYCEVLDRAAADNLAETGPDLKKTCMEFRKCMGDSDEAAEDVCEDYENELPDVPTLDPFFLLMCTCERGSWFGVIASVLLVSGLLAGAVYYFIKNRSSASAAASDSTGYQEIS